MNMILHGIDAPNLVHGNTLSENSADIQEKDRFNVILTNPPYIPSSMVDELLKDEEGMLSLEQFFAIQNAKIKNT